MQKTRILHIIKTLDLGGTEINLFNLVNAIDKNKFECYVAYSYGGAIEEYFEACGNIKLYKYASSSHKITSLASLVIIWRLIKYIRLNKISIIHTHAFNAHIWGLIATKLTGRKVVEHVHDFRYLQPEEFNRRHGKNRQYRYVKFIGNQSDCVIVLTKQNKEYLFSNHLYQESKVREIQNGIPILGNNQFILLEDRKRILQQLGLDERTRIVLIPARIAIEKNIDLIFKIAPEVAAQCPITAFVICGDGPLLNEYRMKTKINNWGKHIRFIGFRSDINKLLSISDVFLLPSFLELHSIAILEAMNMKVPVVVSTGVGCNDEFIDNWQNGILLDPFRNEGWAEAIIRLLKDECLRQRLRENGYQTCRERFDITKTVKRIEDIYVELAKK